MSDVHGAAASVPIGMGAVFSKAVVAATNIFTTDLTVPKDGIVRMTVSLSVDGTLKAKVSRGGTAVLLSYNGGSDLTANSVYIFDLMVKKGDRLNFQISVAATVNLMSAELITSTGP